MPRAREVSCRPFARTSRRANSSRRRHACGSTRTRFATASTGSARSALSHETVAFGVEALARLSHRGGLDADGKSGDGAGLLIQVPQRLIGGDFGVVVLFEWDLRARSTMTDAIESCGLDLIDWRTVPVDVESLGARAKATMPAIWQGIIAR